MLGRSLAVRAQLALLVLVLALSGWALDASISPEHQRLLHEVSALHRLDTFVGRALLDEGFVPPGPRGESEHFPVVRKLEAAYPAAEG